MYHIRTICAKKENGYSPKGRHPCPRRLHSQAKIPTKDMSEAYISSRFNTYQTDSPRDGGRKSVEDVDSWPQPLCQSLIATMRFVEFSNLLLKDSNDSSGGVARLQLGDKRMREKVFLRLLSVGLQRSLEDSSETRGI